jgi:hypothetical protein
MFCREKWRQEKWFYRTFFRRRIINNSTTRLTSKRSHLLITYLASGVKKTPAFYVIFLKETLHNFAIKRHNAEYGVHNFRKLDSGMKLANFRKLKSLSGIIPLMLKFQDTSRMIKPSYRSTGRIMRSRNDETSGWMEIMCPISTQSSHIATMR